MPGKINPVIPEMVIQVSAHLMGKHLSVTVGASTGPLELNIMMPLIAYETLSALALLTSYNAALLSLQLDSTCRLSVKSVNILR